MAQPRYPNETPEYRKAREELLDAEEALREQVERVAALRRSLPPGGEILEDYAFDELDASGASRQVRLSELFEPGRDSLVIYGFMYGPAMERACPMCTSFLDSLDGAAPHVSQRVSLAVAARSPIERLGEFAHGRSWRNLRLVSSAHSDYPLHYGTEAPDGSQQPMMHVFERHGGRIHHFWGSELHDRPYANGSTRHIDLMWPLWNVLDVTREGRGESWYPALEYPG